jgi:hypothetical protein
MLIVNLHNFKFLHFMQMIWFKYVQAEIITDGHGNLQMTRDQILMIVHI